MIIGDGRQGLRDGMPGAELLGLQHPLDIPVGQRRRYLLAAVAIDHVDGVGCKLCRRAQHVLEQRLATERLQHLGQVALHPCALTGGQDYHTQGHRQIPLTPTPIISGAGVNFLSILMAGAGLLPPTYLLTGRLWQRCQHNEAGDMAAAAP